MDYVGTHLNTAMALYRQREGWLYKDRIDMQSMIDMEYRLRVHIHVLSKCISEDDAEPGDAPDTFLYLAARLSSNNDEEINRAAKLACEWLLDDSPKAPVKNKSNKPRSIAPMRILSFPGTDIFTRKFLIRSIYINLLDDHCCPIE